MAKVYNVAVDGLRGSFEAIVPSTAWGYDLDGNNYIDASECEQAASDYSAGLIPLALYQMVEALYSKHVRYGQLKGDFDDDGDIDYSDFEAFTVCYDTVLGDAAYNPIGDFDDNGVIDIYDFFQFSAVYKPSLQTYTLGIYYFYLEGFEGSSDIYAWHDNWDSWCRWLINYRAALLTDYCNGDMPIEFVIKHEVPAGGYDFHSKSVMYGVLKNLEGYNDVDFCIIITEDNLHSGLLAYPSLHTVTLRGLKLETGIRGMEGERHNGEFAINLIFAHEIGHLFRLNHCSNFPCVMSQPSITYSEWLDMGQKLWFCDEHRPQILKNWTERNHS